LPLKPDPTLGEIESPRIPDRSRISVELIDPAASTTLPAVTSNGSFDSA
jgi:hypothetical protein